MSDRKRFMNNLERNVSPDSTTKFFEGEEVFVQNSDQFILGKIKEINVATEKCLVNIDNGESLWVVFKDLKPWSIDIDENAIKCNVCKSTDHRKNNIVVTCDVCFRGYHQKCHQPAIEFLSEEWICIKCRQKQNCHLIENIGTKKTASTSKDPTLPPSSDTSKNHVKKKNKKNSDLQSICPTFRGQKICIKTASLSFNTDEQQRHTSKVKKKKRAFDTKVSKSKSSFDHTCLVSELPPTPPSSISAPETPQTLSVLSSNGEAPPSPNDDGGGGPAGLAAATTIVDITSCRMEELFSIFEEPPSSDLTFPVRLKPVISHPMMRTTKRHLSEKDIDVVGGVVMYKKKRKLRRQSAVVASTRQTVQNGGNIASNSSPPIKLVSSRTSKKGLKEQVYSYYDEINKSVSLEEKLRKFVTGSEYRICGKRMTADGQVQYLVEWVQNSDPI